jgi:hypothetical protein
MAGFFTPCMPDAPWKNAIFRIGNAKEIPGTREFKTVQYLLFL